MPSTYLLNGIDLDDVDGGALGIRIMRDSKPFGGITRRVSSLTRQGRDGNIAGLPTSSDAPPIVLHLRVPFASMEATLALLDAPFPVLSHDGHSAAVELVSVSMDDLEGELDSRLIQNMTVTWSVPDMFWRDPTNTTSLAATLPTLSESVSVMAGLSAPVRDAVYRLKGGLTNLKVTDSNGSFFTYNAVLPSTSWFRFESDTGRAFVTTTDTWTGGVEVSLVTDTGSGDYYFQATPVVADPANRYARLNVTALARSGTPTIEVRSKRAYRI